MAIVKDNYDVTFFVGLWFLFSFGTILFLWDDNENTVGVGICVRKF